MQFPSVVGCDPYRAQQIIRTKLGWWNDVSFAIVPYRAGQRLPTIVRGGPPPLKADRTEARHVRVGLHDIVLFHDTKFDAVAITPTYYGTVMPRPPEDRDDSSDAVWSFEMP